MPGPSNDAVHAPAEITPAPVREMRAHWRVLLAAVLGNALTSSILTFYTIGIFGPALKNDYGWSTEFIFSGLLIWTLTTLVAAPIAGRLADRYGVRKVATLSALMAAPVMMAFSLTGGSKFLYALAWIMIAIVGAGTTPVTWSRAINNHFEKRKGLALGLSFIGSGLMATLLKPVGFWLVSTWGWQGCFVGLGLFPLVSAFAGWVLLAPRNETGQPAASVPLKRDLAGLSLKDAMGAFRLWMMLVGIALIAFVVGGMLPHIETIVSGIGFQGSELLTVVSVLGLATAFGRLSSAFLLDRFWAPAVASAYLVLAAVVMLLIPIMPVELGFGIIVVVVIGATAGMEIDVAAFMVARYFGYRSYSAIYGVIFGVYSVCVALGSIIFGMVLDRAALTMTFTISSILLLGGAVALMSLGSYRFPRTH